MQSLSTSLDSSGLSAAFETTIPTQLWIRTYGAFAAQTVTLQESIDRGTNYNSFVADGVAITFTTDTYKLLELPGGIQFRFSGSGGGTLAVDFRVSGPGIQLIL